MFKALELVGFKSFADKTRFEFPSGITAVVGPNGSGKSNVVDAIKWVLGEQSVRSLRGKEMADCIFNGSGSRSALNAAECTLSFDNSRRALAIDADEVHITRRVYRNGEGEYLINRQPSRLRDIRELLSGTGMGAEAYAIIEQGKVDVLLQASPRDRRAIFEEAAGIGRFKMKKVETLRRLERVEQNLLRLSDIVEEVEARLRSVRAQASKARRYKEHADRLQQLRTDVARADWRALGEKLAALETEITALRDDQAGAAAAAEVAEARALELEAALADTLEALRACESDSAANRERIAAAEATVAHEMARCKDLEEELLRRLAGLKALGVRAGDLDQQARDTAAAIVAAEVQIAAQRAQADGLAAQLVAATESVDRLRRETDDLQKKYVEAARHAGALGAEARSLTAQLEAASAASERLRGEWQEREQLHAALESERAELQRDCDERRLIAESAERTLAEATAAVAEGQRQHAIRTQERHEFQQRQTGLGERRALLQEFEARQEGVGAGARELLAEARQSPNGPLAGVRGMVADLLQADVEMAPLIDLALGETAQCLVFDGDEADFVGLAKHGSRLPGRAGFVRLISTADGDTDSVPIDGLPGVVGRADALVECSSELRPLARRLLGRAWIVNDLPRALELSAHVGGRYDFLTLAGERLSSDGTLSIGPRQAAAGLVSRRSELRDLARRLAETTADIERLATEIGALAEANALHDQALIQARDAQLAATTLLTERRMAWQSVATRAERGAAELARVATERDAAAARQAAMTAALADVETRFDGAAVELTAIELQTADAAARLAESEKDRDRRRADAAEANIELARCEQHSQNLHARARQLERDQQERRKALVEGRDQWQTCRERLLASQLAVLAAEGRLAESYLLDESLAGSARSLHAERDARRVERGELVALGQRHRNEARHIESRLHARQLAAGEVRHERAALADRLRDDYGVELAVLDPPVTSDDASNAVEDARSDVEQEIVELRRKLANLGHVNLDALAELEELDARYTRLAGQHRDLSDAKNSLVRVIHKIDADSRRLFAETLEAVKANFQTLFRKLFGGGQADVVLEEGVDILDGGIEIVARPPGKEPRNISLLSGGEKTLTCVALLMAVFQYRPSTFCVLDEVDASLDEANIERFIGVLQEFLSWTQFIVVTHSKKTMTCASTLHGVTMQESGISKRVSVRFDDVSDGGHIQLESDAPRSSSDETQAA